MKKKAIVVVGATASGKTSLGVHIAKTFGGQVISADSMQIYKNLSISTAKPTEEEMDGIKHHLIDFVDINETYSVSSYCKDARRVFDELVSGGILPVFVGGTGLYIDSFMTNTRFFEAASDDSVRKELQQELEEKGIEALYNELLEIDPEACEKIHPNNIVRVIRALEVFRLTGKTITQQAKESRTIESDIAPLYIGITYENRENLYNRINKRVDIMLENGLLDEAKEFFASDYSATSVNSIGCKELKPFIDGEDTLENCVERLKQETRHYAKRQITWFKRNKSIYWFYADKMSPCELTDAVDKLIKEYLGGDFFG